MKHALLLLFFAAGSLFGQTVYKTSDQLSYDYSTKLTTLRSTGKPFTGVEYTVGYYYYASNRDTTLLRGFNNGELEWSKQYYAKGVLNAHQVFYNHGLKKDSICMERVTFDATTHDTLSYESHVINKKGQKFYRYRSYYQSYQVSGTTKKPVLQYAYTMQFFSWKDASNFDDQQYRKRENYDSSGFHSTYAQQGMYYEFHQNGKVRTKGQYNIYDYRVAHKGQSPSWPNYGKIGTWQYFTQEGYLQREEIYKQGNPNVESAYYYADGKLQARYNYVRMGRDLKLPFQTGLDIKSTDSLIVTQSNWTQDGKLTQEILRTPKGIVINCYYHPNGKPSNFSATFNSYKPIGIWKQWDDKGRTTRFTNYSDESNDTVCYKASNGKIIALNLRDRTKSMEWDLMPADYYGTQSNAFLYKKIVSYTEFYLNGNKKSFAQLSNGKRNGEYMEWDSTGAQVLKATYKDDIPEGQWTEWHPNGRVKKSLTYRNGIRDGACSEYYANGQLRWENIYANGIPGKPKAFSENGTELKATDYLTAFYPASCIDEQLKGVAGITMHYFLADTTMSRSYVTLSDTGMRAYGLKMVAALGALSKKHDYCTPIKPVTFDANEFDMYHSCLMISKTLYTDKNIGIIKAFFARHNIVIDKQKESTNPVLGLEKEYLVYYSSKEILNKQVIVDSIELYIAPNANDPKQGYLMSVDLNFPKGELLPGGGKELITSSAGYSTISIEKNVYVPTTYQNVKETSYYIVYDDLTSDYQYTSYGTQQMSYWALN